MNEKKIHSKKHTEEELIGVMQKISTIAKKKNVFLSTKKFSELCKSIYGVTFIGSIGTKFASEPGRSNGFNELKKQLALKVYQPYNEEFLIDKLYEVYLALGKKQPREVDVVKLTGLSNHTYYTNFGNHLNAVRVMYKAKGIKQEVIIPHNIKYVRKERVGEDISRYNIGLDHAPCNEQGVVAVFSKIHHLIGFPKIDLVQQQFPDCRAYCDRGSKLFRANIEFKTKSSLALKKQLTPQTYIDKNVHFLICWNKDSEKIEQTSETTIIALKDELEVLYENGKIGQYDTELLGIKAILVDMQN